MEMDPQTIDRYLPIIAWLIVGFGGLWLVTSVIGYFQRKAYNLTHAESGSSKNIKPDFLKVDHAKREAAIERGAKFDRELNRREQPPAPVETVGRWSRILATTAVLIGLIVTVVGTLQRVESLQRDFSSWEQFMEIVRQNQLGALVAVAVIAANGYVAYTKIKAGKA